MGLKAFGGFGVGVTVCLVMPKNEPRYVGDKILAAYQALSSCLGLGAGFFLAAICFGLAAQPDILRDWRKHNPGSLLEEVAKPQYAALLGCFFAALSLVVLVWIVGTWRGRRWALWLHLILSAISITLSGMYARPGAAILPVAVLIYAALRLSGNIGPKARKAVKAKPSSSPKRRSARPRASVR